MRKINNKGSSVVITLVVAIVVVAVGASGYFVWHNKYETNGNQTTTTTKKTAQDSSSQQTGGTKQQAASDPYEGWQTYSNATYGISFRYPTDWKTKESSSDSASSQNGREYTIGLQRTETYKYNDTVNMETWNEDLATAVAWKDQNVSAKAAKTTGLLKGRQSVQYTISDDDESSKAYLIAFGNKTLYVESINEWLNIQHDATYWAKFNKVFDSLQIE